MYYQILEEITKINRKAINPEKLTVGIISLEELEENYKFFGFTEATVLDCKNDTHHNHGNLESYNDYLFGIIYGVNAMQIIKVEDRIAIFIKRNLLLIVVIEDKDDSTQLKLLELLEHLNVSKINMERLIYGFLERLISDDYLLLEKIENDLSEHDDKINERNLDKDFYCQISDIRKKLLLLDNYYQQLIVLGEELEENSINIFEEENLHYFKKIYDRVTRLSNNTRMLQDYSVHVREAYHAQLDYDLNRIMKIFTVITTVFLPLTLIVGWYGMNFKYMPEITWTYGYLYVIILSIIIAIICILYFKKKKFL